MNTSVRCLFMWLLCIGCLAMTNPAAWGDGAVVERTYIDRPSAHDPGTVVALLHNRTDRPVTVGTIAVNGHPVKEWPGPDDPVAWHRVTHEILQPGDRGLMLVKLAQFTTNLVRLSIELNGEPKTYLLSTQEAESVRVVAIRYGSDGRRINLFVENSGRRPVRINAVDIDGRRAWESQAGLSIAGGDIEVVRMMLPWTLETGRRVYLRIELTDRALGMSNRPMPGFRLSIESGDVAMARRIGADPLVLESFRFEQEQVERGGEAAPSLARRQGENWSLVRETHGRFVAQQESDLACVFACPTHSTDSYQTSAYLAMRAQRDVEDQPAWQSFVHACRTQPLLGIAVFGGIGDAVRFNGALATEAAANPAWDENPRRVYGLTRYAARHAAPSFPIPMIMIQRDWQLFPHGAPLAIEARQMVYAALAGGAGGVAYRVMSQDWRNENREAMLDEVVAVNAEIRQVRSLLAMGHPRRLASTKHPLIQVACIDALPEALVLVVINHDLRRSPPELPPSISVIEHHDVTIQVRLPEGYGPGPIYRVEGDQREAVDWGEWSPGQLQLTLPNLEATAMLVIEAGEQP